VAVAVAVVVTKYSSRVVVAKFVDSDRLKDGISTNETIIIL